MTQKENKGIRFKKKKLMAVTGRGRSEVLVVKERKDRKRRMKNAMEAMILKEKIVGMLRKV